VADEGGALASLLDYVKRQRGIDFSSYKPATLERRFGKRLQALGITDYAGYLDHLQASPDEFAPLLDTLFINVTGFFRDPEAWETLRTQVMPRIVDGASPSEPLRIWCAGVASGEEAYTVAMLLAEQMGDEDFAAKVKIFATDLDEAVLAAARSATYTQADLEDVPEPLRQRYFEPLGSRWQFRHDLRRGVIFGHHDVLADAPISRLRLLVCRNTLMYFNREAQNRVLARFHFALRPDGCLFLGRAEMLLTRRSLFQPIEGDARLFRKVTDLSFQDRLSMLPNEGAEEQEAVAGEVHLRDVAFDSTPIAEIVVDASGRLALTNAAARALLRLSRDDVGKPFHDLDISFRPTDLRTPIERAGRDRRVIDIPELEWRAPDGALRWLEVRVIPLHDDGTVLGTKVSFQDMTRRRQLADELNRSRREIEVANEELQSTNEELETTNEELQSTVEELETTNEELQSTNEELETMNEELQSTNVEIETVNAELQERTDELDDLNRYTQAVLDGLGMGVVVLDRDLSVRSWNGTAEELWGLRPKDVVGKPFFTLDIGLPVREFRDVVRQCVTGEVDRAQRDVAGHDRKGKPMRHDVVCGPLREPGGSIAGVILLVNGKEPEGA
jgi:two-component system CheB/CheR fusion protein